MGAKIVHFGSLEGPCHHEKNRTEKECKRSSAERFGGAKGALRKDVGEHFGGPKRGQRSPKNQTKMHPNFDGGFDRVLGALWAPEWYQNVGKKLSKNDSDLDHFFM